MPKQLIVSAFLRIFGIIMMHLQQQSVAINIPSSDESKILFCTFVS